MVCLLNQDFKKGGFCGSVQQLRHIKGSWVPPGRLWMSFGSTWFSLYEWASCSLSHCISNSNAQLRIWGSSYQSDSGTNLGWGPESTFEQAVTLMPHSRNNVYLLWDDPWPMVLYLSLISLTVHEHYWWVLWFWWSCFASCLPRSIHNFCAVLWVGLGQSQ